jgi:hypothetical protein
MSIGDSGRPLRPADLLSRAINWIRAEPSEPGWYAVVDGQRCVLRMNDFPDEPLLTVTVGGESLDVEDAPPTWKVPYSVDD